MTNDPSQPVQPVQPTPSTPTEPVPAAVVAVRPRVSSGGRLINVLLIVAAALAVGGVAFAVGRSTASTGALSNAGGPTGGFVRPGGGSFDPGLGGPRSEFAGAMSIGGTVSAIDADSITLTLKDGDEQTISIDDSTTYREATQATAADVAVGDAISIQVDGGRIQNGGADPSSTPELTAGEITVSR